MVGILDRVYGQKSSVKINFAIISIFCYDICIYVQYTVYILLQCIYIAILYIYCYSVYILLQEGISVQSCAIFACAKYACVLFPQTVEFFLIVDIFYVDCFYTVEYLHCPKMGMEYLYVENFHMQNLHVQYLQDIHVILNRGSAVSTPPTSPPQVPRRLQHIPI